MKMRIISGLVLGLTTLAASAQDTGNYQAKISFISPQGDLRILTQKSSGYGFELGANLVRGEGLELWLHGEFQSVSRKVVEGSTTYDAKSSIAGLDLKYVVGDAKIFTGPVVATWDARGNNGAGPVGETAWKLGWRVGVEYPIYKNWGAAISYTATEWRSDSNDPAGAIRGLNPSNPSFLAVSATYKF